MARILPFLLLFLCFAKAQNFVPAREAVPAIAREFRGTWAAVVYNIDWPSSSKLTAAQQQAEMRAILDRMAQLRLNALIFQVRPECDAIYASAQEPWSQWLTGTMGKSPGYDPLEFTIREAHQRGIEVHAWFNPFRALANANTTAAPQHITRSAPELTKRYENFVWCDPSLPAARQRALAAILDVLKRYDVDGIHLDDYFYPYPIKDKRFPDQLSNEQRRKTIDAFMADLYLQVKRVKPWARVGISPFGIWKPGIPAGTTAGLDAYEDLACDARKWLQNGWCDYMAPQLYWRIDGPQCYNLLLEWWRQQGTRPVWPGIASSRIGSSEDPKRRATEIDNQVQLSRSIGRNYAGHMHWSVKALMENRDNVNELLKARYTSPALVPPMPWLSRDVPPAPPITASAASGKVTVRWQIKDPATSKLVVQTRTGQQWQTVRIAPANSGGIVLAGVDAVAVTAVNRYGNTSAPTVLRR